jgi:glycosyltransferase involved in cell wall biosynthesis
MTLPVEAPPAHGAPGDPKISAIIIFLNAQAFIEDAIQSVLAQTDRDWELLLVDDGSTDASSAIAQGHAAAAPERIRYLEHPRHQNRGMSASRNLGIAHARGAYVAFLDADDVWSPERLERHLAVIEARPEVGMVYGPTLYWYSWSEHASASNAPDDHVGDLSITGPAEPPVALLTFLRTGGGSLPGICSLLARRDVVLKVGGFEEDFRGLYEDQVFLSKMCFEAPVYVVTDVLDKYRQHPDSHCSQAIVSGEYHPSCPHPARKRYLLWLDGYLRTRGVDAHSELARAVQNELADYRSRVRYAVLRLPILLDLIRGAARRRLPPRTFGLLRRASRLSRQGFGRRI